MYGSRFAVAAPCLQYKIGSLWVSCTMLHSTLQIFVKTLAMDGPKIVCGETITLTVHASDAIDNVKTKIAKVTCWPTSSQRLMFAALVLQDETVVAFFPVDSTVPDLLPVTVSQVKWPFEAFNEGCNVDVCLQFLHFLRSFC